MPRDLTFLLAELILGLHLGVISFNVFGLFAIPLGGWLNWRFVRLFWWRLLHLASLGVVAVQALAGRICFLTALQDALSGTRPAPMLMSLINRLLYWPLPLWVFAALYAVVFLYAAALWRWVPPGHVGSDKVSAQRAPARGAAHRPASRKGGREPEG